MESPTMMKEKGIRPMITVCVLALMVAGSGVARSQSNELRQVVNNDLGYVIMVPQKAKQMTDTFAKEEQEMGIYNYIYNIPGSYDAITINVSTVFGEVGNLDKAISEAKFYGASKVIDKKNVSNGNYLVVATQDLSSIGIGVYYFTKVNNQYLRACCTGPVRFKKLMTSIVTSIKQKN